MQLFYTKDINENTSEIHFTKEESQHIIKVLRKKEDDILHITNGNGWLFKAKITSAHVKKCIAHIVQRDLQNPRSYRLHLAVAPTKMNDRFEWFLEKATEIGIDSITPILCDHSERKVIKHERFEKIIQSAMKQSLQCYLPTLHPLKTYQEFLDQEFVGQTFIAHCEETSKNTLKEEAASKNKMGFEEALQRLLLSLRETKSRSWL